MRIAEGGLEITVADARDGAQDGSGDSVFFNPTQELNRDITVAVLRAYRDREPRAETYLDAMAASGIRGVRAANEGYSVTCADIDVDAIDLAKENLAGNGFDGEAIHRDVNAVLHDGYYDIVDIDPFGTPMPFADAAFANTEILSVLLQLTLPHSVGPIKKVGFENIARFRRTPTTTRRWVFGSYLVRSSELRPDMIPQRHRSCRT